MEQFTLLMLFSSAMAALSGLYLDDLQDRMDVKGDLEIPCMQ